MSPFVQLADPSRYTACAWDLSTDGEMRVYWIGFFKRHFETMLSLAVTAAVAREMPQAQAERRAAAARRALIDHLDDFAANPGRFGRITILALDAWRDEALRAQGFDDPFIDVKNRENQRTLPLLPDVCRQLDALRGAEQFRAVIEGLFAGNIFDLGAEATTKAFLGAGPDFYSVRQNLRPRPWLIDDYDALERRMSGGAVHHKAIFFIDNAGADFVLGAVPMIRRLARRGTRVVVAANERPSLNDMSIADVRAWWPRIVEAEPSMADLPIELVSTGTGEPLIDLAAVSDELNRASEDADLVILEGMGRGVESNLHAQLRCDALNIAMVKDEMVAKRCGGKIFDLVCRFQPAPCPAA